MTAFWQWLVPQPVWVILVVVGAIPIVTGGLIYALAMSSPIVRWVKPQEIAPPYIGAVTLLFALFASLMMADIWHRETRIGDIVQQEAQDLRAALDVAAVCGTPCDDVREASFGYARLLANQEWSRQWVRLSPLAGAGLDRLLASLSSLDATNTAKSGLLALHQDLRRLRSERYAIMNFDMAPHRWNVLIALGVLTQLVLASIHVGRRVALGVVLGLFTAAFVVSIVYMAELAWPPADATMISSEDLQRILPKPDGT
ncbi:MAG: hypothetical protein K0S56_180 [Microvirga sp.]|jgi:hypothetical protein|nr:hypothetical protein [Microvirga sp.]